MGGSDKRKAWAMLCMVGPLLAAGANGPDIATGRAIYQQGTGRDPITVAMFGQRVDNPRTFSCAACHGDYGSGGSEGGIAAPSLIVSESLSDEAVATWLRHGLEGREKQASEGERQRMPRYTMSARDRAALASYIRRFPNPPVPGLTEDKLVIGLETTGMGLDAAGRAALMREMTDLFAKVAGYGLFGRRIDLRDATGQGADADVFAAIVWDPRAAIEAPLRLSVRPPAAGKSFDLCASVQPHLAEQYRILTSYLDAKGVRYRTSWTGSTPPFDVPAPATAQEAAVGEPGVEIHLGPTLEMRDDRPVYIFADLIGPLARASLPPNTHLVLPTRVRDQERAAREIQSRHPVDPGTAGAIAMMQNAARSLFSVLARSGRRIATREACASLAQSTRQYHRLDGLSDGTIVEIGP